MNVATREKIAAAGYDELTEFAENRIRALIRSPTDESRAMAIGIWDFWYNLTAGYQRNGDADRLEALFRSNGSPLDAPKDHAAERGLS